MRRLEYLTNCGNGPLYKALKLIVKIKYKKLAMKLGFSIPINTFGPGLYIPHYGTIVVNGKAKVGSDCKLCTDVCLGNSRGGVPVIGNNVYIAPGAKIFGDIVIGDNCFIGANAVVNKSFPSDVTIVGVPAHIVESKRNYVAANISNGTNM